MTPANSTRKPKSHAFGLLVLLIVILGVLFWKSFVPGFVQFSNDGPLGQLHSDWLKLPSGIFGAWYDLNDIGNNSGAYPPSVVTLLRWLLGPVGTAKFLIPIALLILGLSAWVFFRRLKLTPLAAILGALAAMLTSTFFSDACWGVPSHEIAFGLDFLALALIVSNAPNTRWYVRWTRLALAGMLVGLNVEDAVDIGAIFSIFVAAFALFHSFIESDDSKAVARLARGVGRVALIALFAVFIATQSLVSLVGFAITGVVGTGQSEQAKAANWDNATEWSFPKIETLDILVPGLFGYRMDTPAGGEYWGAIGRHPSWDRYFAGQQSSPSGPLRFCGAGYYAGPLTILIALWAIAQSLRRRNSVFSETHRRYLWFWTAVLIVCLPLAWGRFAPFYAILYKLPYFSTIRNPTKFLFVFAWALVTIFAYGVHGLSRRYLEVPTAGTASLLDRFKTWRAKTRGFDRNWTSICIVLFFGSLLAWLVYALQKPNLVAYLQTVGFPDKTHAGEIAAFSIRQVGWFILFYAVSAGLVILILSGAFTGPRARWGGVLLGVLLVVDLGRADLPWIVPLNYLQKDDVDPANLMNSTNPVINFLRNKPYEHRVVGLPNLPKQYWLFRDMYRIEWAQHHFPYYNIQSLNKIQMSRMPVDLLTYEEAASQNVARWWELTDTRYILAPTVFLNALNEQLDPVQHRFHIALRFDIVPKPGITVQDINKAIRHGVVPGPKLTAVESTNGEYAVFDFSAALPRAKLYANWETNSLTELRDFNPKDLSGLDLDIFNKAGTNGFLILKKLFSPSFDPWKTVLLTDPLPTSDAATPSPGTNAGTVTFKSYAPKDIVLEAHANVPCVLLLNSKYDPHWHVFVDGKPKPLLHCNFIMRGVFLTAGSHTVEFKFSPPLGPLYVSLSAIGVGILLCGFLFISTRRTESS